MANTKLSKASTLTEMYQWRHDERDGVSNQRRLDCLLNRFSRHRSKKTAKLRATGLYEGNPPVTGGFPSQKAFNAEIFSIWWRHYKSVPKSEANISEEKIIFTDCQNCYTWIK